MKPNYHEALALEFLKKYREAILDDVFQLLLDHKHNCSNPKECLFNRLVALKNAE